ncbi:hypothetical protein HAX54_022358, partial [Datura stramonium]|nr:hypothetical protein [Datura stramonium]
VKKTIISAWCADDTQSEARNSKGTRWVHVTEHNWCDGLLDTVLVHFSGHQNSSARSRLFRVTEEKRRDELRNTELGFQKISAIPVSFCNSS